VSEQANTQLVQQAYQCFRAGDIQSVLNLLAEDVLWEMPEIANVPFSGSWRGRQQAAIFFQKLTESQDVIEFEPEQFLAQADKVVVLGHFTMRVKATGREFRSDWVHVWAVADGKFRHVREYVDSLAVSRAHAVER
jgi:ketosteroid isomerase-like protein